MSRREGGCLLQIIQEQSHSGRQQLERSFKDQRFFMMHSLQFFLSIHRLSLNAL